jgi:hypothetical protein
VKTSWLSRVIVTYLCLVGAGADVQAQSVTFDAFAVPKSGFTTCRAFSPPRSDSAAIGVVYGDESEEFDARETVIHFDSAGTVLKLNLFASKQIGDSSYGEAFTIRFLNAGGGTHMQAVAQLPPGTKPTDPMPTPVSIKKEFVELTPDDMKRAAALGMWIWQHRCPIPPRDM